MWRRVNSRSRKEYLKRAASLMKNTNRFYEAMKRVTDEWIISCEKNLTNNNLNRIAWLGQAACCIASGCPQEITRNIWCTLTEEEQNLANKVAARAILEWESKFGDKMPKLGLGKSVLEAARERIAWTFDHFEKISVSFSGGKDSTVMLHLAMDEAIARQRKIALLFIDLEGQYRVTIEHVATCYELYRDHIEPFWVCLPIHLRNAVSVYETHWICWAPDKHDAWIRNPPEIAITADKNFFPFFRSGMEFEEFVPEFSDWYAGDTFTATLVGIRTDESLNRFRTIAGERKAMKDNKQWTTWVTEKTLNIYPIYDWKTEDLWIYHAHFGKPYNRLYDLMHKAGLTIHQMRICQPYGDDQRKGLWLFHLIEPQTWARIVARVNGANGGALYIQEWGNINGYRRVTKPPGHTWESFAHLLIDSMPPRTKEHYDNKVIIFRKWWMDRGYPEGIPDEAPYELEAARKVPSWRRICKSLLRNDYWCKGLSFTQHRSDAYEKYLEMMKRRKEKVEWQLKNNGTEPITISKEDAEQRFADMVESGKIRSLSKKETE